MNRLDAEKKDVRLLCVASQDFIQSIPNFVATFTFTDGTTPITLKSVGLDTVFKSITAYGENGDVDTYVAGEGAVIFGWVITEVPEAYANVAVNRPTIEVDTSEDATPDVDIAGPDYDTLVEEKSNINILTDGVYANVTFGTNYLNLSAQGAKATYIVSGNYDGYYTLSMKVTSASTRVLQVIVNGETYTTNTKKSTSQKELALTVKMKKGANVITFAAYGAQAAPSLYGFTLTRNSALAELSDTSVTVKAEDFDSSTSTLTGTVTSTDVPAQTLLDSSVNFNSYTIYKVTVPEDGIYMFTVRYICMDENIQTRIFRVTVDGSRELALVAPLTQSSTSVADAESVVSIFSQPLTAGEHTFKIGGGGSYFNSTASPSPNLVSFSLTLVTPAEAE